MSDSDKHTRRTLLSAIVGSLFGYTAAQKIKPDDSQALLPGGAAGTDVLGRLTNLEHIIVGDDPQSLLSELNQFPKLMLDSNGSIRLLEEYGNGTEVLTLDNTAQLIISDSLANGKEQIDNYPALIIVRGSGATLVEQ